MALLDEQIDQMTRLMEEVKSSYEEQLNKISSLLDYTAGSCCDSSAPTSFPSSSPSEPPTKTESFVPSSAPSKSSQPTPNCVGTDISEIADHITDIDSIAMQGNYLLVSDEDNDQVNLLKRENRQTTSWSTVKVYEPSTVKGSYSKYGNKVALDDNHVVVTSDDDTGRLFIYDRATDTETVFENPGAGNDLFGYDDLFGSSVALSDNYIIIGARYDESVAYRAGSVHIYEKKDGAWVFSHSITSPDGRSNDFFGSSVAIDGYIIVVGATGAGPNASGAAYVYRNTFDTFEYFSTLVPENGSGSDYFGLSVAISTVPRASESLITVGSPYTDRTTTNVGSVYFYRISELVAFTEEKSGSVYNQQYGYTVASEESRIAVSSIGRKVDIYEDKLDELLYSGSMTSAANYFGTKMAISGNTVVTAGGYSWDESLYQQTICVDF
eukprot:CAMPEP_0194312912 /NCGR_PEP_ID=MMETSP0171-20130528/9814_1 /TAXON_ID=218684 /ORGANISM="Corethron pennatum, Strain L29A3" /LENGTH=438 /DNA_ID=CAMNT_0039067635 /DNA_START=189 /DNA_END=1505 /DNA_ORIENTATION=+